MRKHLLAAAAAFVAVSASAEAPSADQIIEQYIAARGGRAAIAALKSIVIRGEYREGDSVSATATMALQRPYYKLVGDPDQKAIDFAEGYDGSAWEYYGDPGIVLRTVGAASAAGRHRARFDHPLIDYRRHGTEVQLLGTAQVGERPAYRLLMTLQDGFREEALIDQKTFLLLAERKAAPIHAFGEKVTTETRFSDYRPVEGVLFAFLSTEVEIGTGRVLNEFRTKSITANQDYDPIKFSPAEFTRTPLQKLLEQLYAERADVSAVMWSYADFRYGYPKLDSHEGIEMIGYQMLKMGDVAAAVELLKANAADYPRAASAAFGLGRAYKTAGNIARAREEFKRALKLDPNHKRAAEGLKSLP
jgi:tetratricopeptide (TPR) repeat protein